MQTAGSLIFRPKRAPRGWRLVATRTWYLWLVVVTALALSDGVSTFDWIVLGLFVVAVALAAPAWIRRLRGRASGRYDERDEIELPAELGPASWSFEPETKTVKLSNSCEPRPAWALATR